MIAIDANLLVYAHRRESRHHDDDASIVMILESFMQRPRVIGGVVHDARVAVLCVAHGTEALLTRDHDFSLFPELMTRDPVGA